MAKSAKQVRKETYLEVAGWLTEVAEKMRLEDEKSVFEPRTGHTVLRWRGVKRLANSLLKKAKEVR